MLSAVPEKVFDWAIGIVSALLVSLTLYTAYFGVFPDGLQRSAHLLLAMALVYIGALRALVRADGSSGLNRTLQKLWILLVLAGGVVTTGHHMVNFDAINDRWGEITDYEIVFAVVLLVTLFDACRRTIGWLNVNIIEIFFAAMAGIIYYIYTCLENTCNHITKLSWTEGVLVFIMEQVNTK